MKAASGGQWTGKHVALNANPVARRPNRRVHGSGQKARNRCSRMRTHGAIEPIGWGRLWRCGHAGRLRPHGASVCICVHLRFHLFFLRRSQGNLLVPNHVRCPTRSSRFRRVTTGFTITAKRVPYVTAGSNAVGCARLTMCQPSRPEKREKACLRPSPVRALTDAAAEHPSRVVKLPQMGRSG